MLFELELTGCNEITEAGLWACLTPRIVSLTLTDCINIADEAVSSFITSAYFKIVIRKNNVIILSFLIILE